MSTVTVYSFAGADGVTQYVDSVGDFLFNGTWSSSGTYLASPLNAVSYGAALYMCIRDNIGDNPQRPATRLHPQSWSIMSVLYDYQSGTSISVAEEAYNLAVSGTNIAWAAYYLAQIGTNTGSAAYDLAGSAYALAGSAVNDAAEAVGVANGAFTIAVIGTSAAATAQATADAAYALAVTGTNNPGGFAVGTDAYALAESGTNIAWAAYYLAQIGTNTGSAALEAAAAAQLSANAAFAIAVIGTNFSRTLVHCAGFTPVLTGPDACELPVPYAYDGSTVWNWSVVRLNFRVQTSGTGSSVIIEKSSGEGFFNAVVVGTVTVEDNLYQGSNTFNLGTVNSGDKLRFNITELGTTQNWTLTTEISHP